MPAEAVVEHVQMLAFQWLRSGGHDDMAVVAIGAARSGGPPTVAGAKDGMNL